MVSFPLFSSTRVICTLLLLLCGSSSILAQISWATLTALDISNMPASNFSTITPDQLGSIPAQACTGFNGAQINAIPAASGSGFTPAQVGYLQGGYNWTACSGFYDDLLDTVNTACFSTFTAECVSSLPDSSLSKLNTFQVSAFSLDGCSGLGKNIAGLNPEAFAGLSADCLAAFDPTDKDKTPCPYMSAVQIMYIPAPVFQGWTQGCVSFLANDAFSQISADQLGNLTTDAVGGFSFSTISFLSVESGAGWSNNTLAAIDSAGCAGFGYDHVAAMIPSAFQGWTRACVSFLNVYAWSTISADQLSYITYSAASGLQQDVIGNLPPASGAGWSDATLAGAGSLISSACAGFAPAHVGAMLPETFAGWTQPCVGKLAQYAWNLTNADQIGFLTGVAAAGLQYETVQNMPAAAAEGWTADTFSRLAAGACGGLTAEQVGFMIPATFGGWSEQCVSNVPVLSWTEVSSFQISYFNPAGAVGLQRTQVAEMPAAAAAGWTVNNLGWIGADGCAGFSYDAFNRIPPVSYPAWAAACIAQLDPVIFTQITSDQLEHIPANATYGFVGAQLSVIPDSVLKAVNPFTAFARLTPVALPGFSANQLAILIQNWGDQFLNLWSVNQLDHYGVNNYSAILALKAMNPPPISPAPFSQLPANPTWLQVIYTVTQAFPASAFVAFSPTTAWGITKDQAALLPEAAIVDLANQFSPFILPDTLQGLSCSQLSLWQQQGKVDLLIQASQDVLQSAQAGCFSSTIGGTSTGPADSTGSTTRDFVTTGNDHPHGMKPGAITGIVIGVIATVGLAAGVGIYIIMRRRRSNYSAL